MPRLYFDVLRAEEGWEVQATNALPDDIPAHFKSKPEAVAFTLHLARGVWRGTRRLTGVRVRDDQGGWREILRCGEVDEDG